jgi:hypothetical protein
LDVSEARSVSIIRARVMKVMMTLVMETQHVSEMWNCDSAVNQIITGERFSEYLCRESFNSSSALIINFPVSCSLLFLRRELFKAVILSTRISHLPVCCLQEDQCNMNYCFTLGIRFFF